MTRNFERLSKTSDNNPKSPEDSNAKLERLRAEHGLKTPLTAEQLAKQADEASITWRKNHHAAIDEVHQEAAQYVEMPSGYIPPKMRMRGGVIEEGKLDKYTYYLQDDEREIFKNTIALKRQGIPQKDLPPKERVVSKMYDAIRNRDLSIYDHSNQDVYDMLDEKRKTSQYQEAFPEYGQSPQPPRGPNISSMSLQEQMPSMDPERLLQTSSQEETGSASSSGTEQQYDRFPTIEEGRKEALNEYAYNLIIPDDNTKLRGKVTDDNEFNFVVECLKQHLPGWNTTDKRTYNKAYQKLFTGEW